MIKNKKAQSIWDIVIFAVIIVLIALGFGLFKFAFHTVTEKITSVPIPETSLINWTDATDKTIVKLDNGFEKLDLLGFAIILGMILNIFVSNYLVKGNPVFFIVYILITILMVLLAMPLANMYETLLSNNIFGATLQSNTLLTFTMLYLPYIVAVVGLFGGLFMAFNVLRDNQGGSYGGI
jgi:hypothetical protein